MYKPQFFYIYQEYDSLQQHVQEYFEYAGGERYFPRQAQTAIHQLRVNRLTKHQLAIVLPQFAHIVVWR